MKVVLKNEKSGTTIKLDCNTTKPLDMSEYTNNGWTIVEYQHS